MKTHFQASEGVALCTHDIYFNTVIVLIFLRMFQIKELGRAPEVVRIEMTERNNVEVVPFTILEILS